MRPGLWPAEVIPRYEMVRADRASRFRVLTGYSPTFAAGRSVVYNLRSQFGTGNGAPRQRAGAELSTRHEGELACRQQIRPLPTLAARLIALRAPLPENSNDFGLLCAQVYASSGHCDTFVGQDQHRASSQPVEARQAGSARFSDWPARA